MNFTEAIQSGFQKYIIFDGRASRSEYWYWVLFVVLASIGMGFLDLIFFPHSRVGILNTLFGLAVFLPGLAVCVRRLHDLNRTGWWVLVWLIPIVGWLILLIFMIQEGTESDNRFGSNPLNA